MLGKIKGHLRNKGSVDFKSNIENPSIQIFHFVHTVLEKVKFMKSLETSNSEFGFEFKTSVKTQIHAYFTEPTQSSPRLTVVSCKLLMLLES